jgi:hypothetical protein
MDDERGLYTHIVSAPAQSVQYSFSRRSPQQFVELFEETFPEPSFSYLSAKNLLPALMGLLYLAEDTQRSPEFDLEFVVGDNSWRYIGSLGLADRYAEFASYLAFYAIIPVELSPPKGQSLGSLLAHPAIWGIAIFADQSAPLVVIWGYGGLVLMRFAHAYLSGAERPMADLGEYHMAILLERLIPGFKYRGRSRNPNQDDEDE